MGLLHYSLLKDTRSPILRASVGNSLKLYQAASKITGLSDDDPLTTWLDSGKNGNDSSQSVAGDKPTYKINQLNNLPAIDFDGNDDLDMSSGLVTIPKGASTIFIVALQDVSPSAQERLLTFSDSGSTKFTIRYSADGDSINYFNNGTEISKSIINNDFNIIRASHDGVDAMKISMNGGTAATGTQTPFATDVDAGNIGSGPGQSQPLNGQIACIFIYNKLLNDLENADIENLLSISHNILLQGTLAIPAGFNTTPPFSITFDGAAFTTDLTITDFKITPTTTYFVTTTGSNGNDGLTVGNPKADVDGAISTGNATGSPYEILVQGGTYNRNRDWSTTPTQDCNIIGENGVVILSSQEDGLSFVSDSGAFKATRSVVGWVYDQSVIDSNGDYQRLVLAVSIAACQATPGTWFTDNVEVWVHTTDSRDLSIGATDIRVYLKVNPPLISSDITVYMENLNIEGFQNGNIAVSNNSSADVINVYANTCSFKYSLDNNAVISNGATEMIFDTCITAFAFLDGFNYHDKNTVIPRIFEVNCTVRQCGQSGSVANNASTMHDGGTIVRVGGDYSDSEGRNIHDVSAGTQSWNIGCNNHDSRDATDAGSINWTCGDGNGTEMWLTNCLSSGSNKDWKTNATDIIRINNSLFHRASVDNGTSFIFRQLNT